MKKLELNDLIKEISKVKANQIDTINILNEIEIVLKSFEGKQISKRIQTAIEKVLPEYNVYYGKSYSWYELTIWGNGIDYNSRLMLNLGYFKTNEIFNFEKFVELNKRYYLDFERNEKLIELEQSGYLPKLLLAYNTLVDEYETVRKSIPDVYPISSFFNMK